jgi:hypothetical protein
MKMTPRGVVSGAGVDDANYRYVRAGASGTGSGLDWTNAFTSIPSTPTRGLTYWLADGSAAGRVFDTANSGTTTITFRKATQASHGTATGWSDAYGAGQFIFTSSTEIYTDYWVFDGAKRNSDWWRGEVDEYGLKFAGIRLDVWTGDACDNTTFRYCDLHGGGRDTGDGDDVVYSLLNNTGITFQSCSLRDSDRTIWLSAGGLTNWLVERCYIARNASQAANHGEMQSIGGNATNYTFRYNMVEDCEGTAIFAGINDGTISGLYIYGNVFQHTLAYNANTGRPPFGTDPGTHTEGIAGIIYIANDASNDNFGDHVLFYNNSVYGIRGSRSGIFIEDGDGGNEIRNNVWFNCSAQTDHSVVGGVTISHNWYYLTTASGDASGTKQTGSADPFVATATNDFHLSITTTAGFDTGSPYNIDPDGVTRATWSRGAYEHV